MLGAEREKVARWTVVLAAASEVLAAQEAAAAGKALKLGSAAPVAPAAAPARQQAAPVSTVPAAVATLPLQGCSWAQAPQPARLTKAHLPVLTWPCLHWPL